MEKEFTLCLKTGYLLKWVKQSWRIYWFTLHESELICHAKRDKSVVSEIIPLQGTSVVCPCYDIEELNIECAFKLSTPSGEDLLFQASGSQDRDRWAHAIGAVIRSISSAYQVSNSPAKFQHFRTKASVSEVLGALQDPDAGVEMSSHVRDGIVHKNSFKGSDIIDWLLRWNIVRRRGDGVAMAQALLKLGHLQEVDMADGTAGLLQMFKDGEKLYRFTSLNLGVQRNSYFDCSDSDSSLSDDEDDQRSSEKVKKGKVTRTGFMLKKRSFRKGMRLVRVILRDNPPSLEYESPFQLSKKNLPAESQQTKFVDLNNCCLVESSKSSIELPVPAVKDPKVSPKLRVYVRSRGKKCRTFQAKDEDEWFEYFHLLLSLCGMKKSAELKEKDGTNKKEDQKDSRSKEGIQKDSVNKEVVKDIENKEEVKKDGEIKKTVKDEIEKDSEVKKTVKDEVKKDSKIKKTVKDQVKKDGEIKKTVKDEIEKDGEIRNTVKDEVKRDSKIKKTVMDEVKKDGKIKKTVQDEVKKDGKIKKTVEKDRVNKEEEVGT